MTNTPPPYPHSPQQPPRRKRKVWPWVLLGVVVLVFGGCVAIIGTAGKEVGKAVDAAASSINQPPPAAAPAPAAPSAAIPPLSAKPPKGGKNVVYEIISDSPQLNSVTYFDEQSDLKQEASAAAPWTKSLVNTSTFAIVGLGAQTEGTSVTCRITVDGKVKDEQTSTGKYAVVNCTASV